VHELNGGLSQSPTTDYMKARKPESTFDNIVRDFGVRYVEGYTSPNFADVVANAPFSE
jgi:hypothetical protein